MTESQLSAWPTSPYKGLSYYSPEDAPIFAGREADVRRCAKLLGAPSTRVLLLHGRTGCGKSSFLRAGLIPFLEDPEHGFSFLREWRESERIDTLDQPSAHDGKPTDHGTKVKALFVRSTDAPLPKLAEVLHEFTSHPYKLRTPLGVASLDLSAALLAHTDRESYLADIGKSGARMVAALTALAKIFPRTLILVVDQAEEVLTVKAGADGEEARSQFFDFLAEFSRSTVDLKLLVALRTEWYCLFYNQIRQREWDPANIRDYLLSELTEAEMAFAIQYPASKEPVGAYGAPYAHYHFSYAGGLPALIARDLTSAAPQGGKLPVLQIVCERLYSKTKDKAGGASWTITADDYRGLGGVKGQLGARVQDVLTEMCNLANVPSKAVPAEVDRWRAVLSTLAKSQLDGTVTTDLKAETELQSAAEHCIVDFPVALKFLSNEDKRIVQRVEVLNLNTNEKIVCYSLGHDAIGLALKAWKEDYDARQSAGLGIYKAQQRGFRYGGLLFTLAGVLVMLVSNSSFYGVLLAYGLLFLVVSLFKPETLFRGLLLPYVNLLPRRVLARLVQQDAFKRRVQKDPYLREAIKRRLTS